MTQRRISRTLMVEAGRIGCLLCGHPLANEGQPWKQAAALTVVPVRSLPGAPMAVHQQVVLRRFGCPSCGALLDTETALPEDPFLDDVLEVPVGKD